MFITTVTSREFNQDTSGVKKAAQDGPVFITNRDRPTHVLLSIHEWQTITSNQESIVNLPAMPGVDEMDSEPSRLTGNLNQLADPPNQRPCIACIFGPYPCHRRCLGGAASKDDGGLTEHCQLRVYRR